MNRRSLLLSAGAATLAGCATPAAPRASDFALTSDLNTRINTALDRIALAPGMAFAVYSREGTYARGFGVTDIGTRERADADTAFYIASSTKSFTALALAKLQAHGEIDLMQPIGAYAPDARFPDAVRPNDVKLRDLLSHTHGIENNGIGFRVAFSGQHDPETLWRLLSLSNANTQAPLGTFAYTNVGYNMATVMTDRNLGIAWQDLLARELFAPAGLTRTSARMSTARNGGWRIAMPHRAAITSGPVRLYLEKTDQTMQSAGGMVMSANDAVRWLELMVNDGRIGRRQIAPPEAVLATRENIATTAEAVYDDYRREHYGLGWYSLNYRGATMYQHFGGFAGFRAHISYIPALGVGVAAFMNDSSAPASYCDVIANYVYDRTGGHADAETVYAAKLDRCVQQTTEAVARVEADIANRATRQWTLTRPRAAYAGAYESERMGRIQIAMEGEAMNVACGVLRSRAEPFTRPDSVRVELVPYQGMPIQFDGDGAAPAGLTIQGERLTRV